MKGLLRHTELRVVLSTRRLACCRLEGERVRMGLWGEMSVGEEGVWCEGPVSEPVDEDGNPYFDPYDPEQADRVVAKWAEEHIGFMD